MEFTENSNLLSIKKELVPLFLQSSKLYRNFEDKNISVPSKFFCNEISINSKTDLVNTLEILRYWMVDMTPWDVYEYIMGNYNDDYSDIIEKFHDLFIIEEIKIILEYLQYDNAFDCDLDLSYFVTKSKYGSANLFEYVLFHSIDIDEEICCHACEFGNLEVLKLSHQQGFKHQPLEYVIASRNGNHECLQFLFDNKVPYPIIFNYDDDDEEEFLCYQTDPYEVAAEKGYIECLKCLHKNKAPKRDDNDEVISLAIRNGNIECLKFLIENGWEKSDTLINSTISEFELDEDIRLKIIKYLHSVGCKFDDSCSVAVEYGVFDCLKFAHTNGCELTTETACIASDVGNLECLKYAHENGIQLNDEMLRLSLVNGNLDCLKYCHENGIELENQNCLVAAENGKLNCLKYCHQNGCKINEDVLDKALEHKNFNCVEYALNNGAKGPDNIDILIKDYYQKKIKSLKEFEDVKKDLPEELKDTMDDLVAGMDNIC